MVDYGILADVVKYVHAAVVVFILAVAICYVFAFEYAGFRKFYAYVYMPVVTVMVLSQIFFGRCPLVMLENSLRSHADPSHVRMESFVTTYCERYFDVYIAPELVTLAILILGLLTVVMIVHMIRHRMR